MDKDYEVGYCRPPLETRWKKGQSGYPQGRRKGSRNARTIWREALTQPVTVKKKGRRRTVTTLEALVVNMIQRATAGDRSALEFVLNHGLMFLKIEAEMGEELDADDRTSWRHIGADARAEAETSDRRREGDEFACAWHRASALE